MTACARGCTLWRRHLQEECPVHNGADGIWVGVTIEDPDTLAELRAMSEDDLKLATGYTIGQYGRIEKWHECRGCQPRDASHGVLCDQCYTKLHGWLAGPRNLAWCWSWLAGDLVPGQSGAGGDKIKASRTPPAAMSITIHDLRQNILEGLGQWLGLVCGEFDLSGPGWWRHRIDEARRRSDDTAEADWRAWLPQGPEVQDACRFLAGWLDRACAVEDLALTVFDAAGKLHRRVAIVAPWEAKATRMPDLVCPACDREALVRWEGDEHLVCRRCSEVVPRQRYDVWSAGLEQEREAS